MDNHRKGTLEMIAAMAISGTIGMMVVLSGQSPLSVIFHRCLLGSAVLFLVCLWRGYLRREAFDARMLGLSLLGGAALLANWYFLFSAYATTSIGIATTVYNTQPLIMIVFGVVFFKERITQNMALWFALSVVGLLLVSESGNEIGGGMSAGYLWGIAQAFIAAFFYAIAALLAKLLKGHPPTLIALMQMLLGAVVLWPLTGLALPVTFFSVPTFALLALGVVHTGLMYILLYGALQKIEAYRAASIAFIYPMLAIFIDKAFFKTDLSGLQWAGMALILLGAAGINLKWAPIRRASPQA